MVHNKKFNRFILVFATALPTFLGAACLQNKGDNLVTSGAASSSLPSSNSQGSSPNVNPTSSSSPSASSSTSPLSISAIPMATFVSNSGSSIGMSGAIFNHDTSMNSALGADLNAIYVAMAANTAYGQSQNSRVVSFTAVGGMSLNSMATLGQYLSIYTATTYNPNKWSILMPNVIAPIIPKPTSAQFTNFYARSGFGIYNHSLGYIILAGGTVSAVAQSNMAVIPATPGPVAVTLVTNAIPSPNATPPVLSEVSPALKSYFNLNCSTFSGSIVVGQLMVGRVNSSATVDQIKFFNPGLWTAGPTISSTWTSTPSCTFAGVINMAAFNGATASQVTITGGPPDGSPQVSAGATSATYTWTVTNNSSTGIVFSSIAFDVGSGYSHNYNNNQSGQCNSSTTLTSGSSCTFTGYFTGPASPGIYNSGFLKVQYQTGNTILESTKLLWGQVLNVNL